MIRMGPIFKAEILIYQSKVNLDEKLLVGKMPHLIDPEVRKMLGRVIFGSKNTTFHSNEALLIKTFL